jgi:hypothetical protein
MFFLIRCVFWLTVVFHTIFSAPDPLPPARQTESGRQADITRQVATAPEQLAAASVAQQGFGQMAQAWVASAVTHFWSKSSGRCGTTRDDCVALAARLSDFARNHSFDESAVTNVSWTVPTTSRAAAVPARLAPSIPLKTGIPLPPLRPQRAHVAANR